MKELQLLGQHNYENVMAAAAAAMTLGVSLEAIGEAAREFKRSSIGSSLCGNAPESAIIMIPRERIRRLPSGLLSYAGAGAPDRRRV